MDFGTIVAILLFGGLILMAVGHTLKSRGNQAGGQAVESVGRAMYRVWVILVLLTVAAIIWLAYAMSK